MKISGIYKVVSPSGSVYIGQTKDFKARLCFYRKARCKGQRHLYHSIIKYGWDAHSCEIIHRTPSDINQSVLNAYEILYISQYRSCGVAMLNIADGGFGGAMPDHIRKAQSERMKGHTPWNKGMKGFRKGYKMTQEHKDKISKANKGRILSDSELHRLRTINIGRANTDEQKAKNREWQKNKKLTPEHIEKIRQKTTGQKRSDDCRKKMSEQRKGKKRINYGNPLPLA